MTDARERNVEMKKKKTEEDQERGDIKTINNESEPERNLISVARELIRKEKRDREDTRL